MRHFTRAASAVIGAGALLSIGGQTVAAPPLKADALERYARPSLPNIRHARPDALIRPGVALPSSRFTTYTEGELVSVRIPSNWRKLPAANAVTFAPEGAYGNAGVRSVFTHGIAMGLARNDRHDLRVTTDDLIKSQVLVNPSPDQTFQYSPVTIGSRPGLHTVLSNVSEATGELERIEMFTTLLHDGTLFYVLTVAPRDRASDYEATFRRVVESIRIMDCERCARH